MDDEQRTGANPGFALGQIAVDLCGVTLLVFFTGAPESTFGFAYLLVIVGACTVLPTRWALGAAVAALAMYIGVSLVAYLGVARDADPLAPLTRMSQGHFIRVVGLNAVAMVAAIATERATVRRVRSLMGSS